MELGIDKFDNTKTWDKLYDLLPNSIRSPFFTSGYYKSYKMVDSAEAECFWMYRDENNFLFYPYLIKSINELGYELDNEYFDISGAYGYNGPIGVVDDPELLDSFSQKLKKYFKEKNVVTEFVRYCPLIDNKILQDYTTKINVLENVYVNLSKGYDWVWNESYDRQVRKAVRKANSYDLKVQVLHGNDVTVEALKVFYEIYEHTMTRRDADDFYFFPLSFFLGMRESLSTNLCVALSELNDQYISTELIVFDGDVAYGFLGGTLKEYYKYKPNTFQRDELIKVLLEKRVTKYSLGGAVKGDSLYKFKSSFARNCDNPFYIGTYIHDKEMYQNIVDEWKKKYPDLLHHQNKIQCYRETN